MIITTNSIVSNSEMIKNYKSCREKADSCGKIFILKNNQPDAVLFSVAEYDRFSALIEHMETLNDEEIAGVIEALQIEERRKAYSIDRLKNKNS